jgi:small subunit ribosomal protein S18
MLKLICRSLIPNLKHINSVSQIKSISLTSVNSLKKIEKHIESAKKTIIIEGKYLDDQTTASDNLLKTIKESRPSNQRSVTGDTEIVQSCSFCHLEKQGIFVQYYDLPVIRQFLKDDGTVLHRKITGLCKRQQKKLLVLVKQAKYAGLIMGLQPKMLDGSQPSTDTTQRREHLKFNGYFDSYEEMRKTHKYL